MKRSEWQALQNSVLEYVKKIGYDVNNGIINLDGFIIIFSNSRWTLYRPGNVEKGECSLVDLYSEFYDQMTDFKKLDAALNNPGQFVIQENNKTINDILDKLN